jgi:hypothetical protein
MSDPTLRNLLLKNMVKIANQMQPGMAAQTTQQVDTQQVNAQQNTQVNDGATDPQQQAMNDMQTAEALAPLEVLGNIYQEQAWISQVLSENANNIATVLPRLVNTVNMLGQWLVEHKQHEELEDRAFQMQQLVAKQQSVGYNPAQQMPQQQTPQPQNPNNAGQYAPQPNQGYTPQYPEPTNVSNTGVTGTFANYDQRGITPPKGY